MASSWDAKGGGRRGNYILCQVRSQTVLLKFSMLLCKWKSDVISYISKLSKPLVMKIIRIWYISFNFYFGYCKCPRCGKRQITLWGGQRVIGCSSLSGAGEQVCAVNIVIYFQPTVKIMIKY